ncbi:MAG: aminotransferase class V-fold PLP-dependent enzyme [Candidatus Polarisedimenticolaceae bacterium]|nr:aminotransferase class V-fold PLP-dependent enzyme [Candidatus Polarisedimenticolaceae bacterium]
MFSLKPEIIYLNHAAVAPWPDCSAEAVRQFADENAHCGAQHYPRWLLKEQALRQHLAQLINAPSSDTIALLKNTSEALSMVAYGLTWQPGDNIVSFADEFPSNRIVWQSLSQFGVELRCVEAATAADPEAALMALCDERTRLITTSSVQYATGMRIDLQQLGDFCQQRDILFCVDAIQSLGVLPFDVQQIHADFVMADGHKWMLGPEGLALFYCHPELYDQLKLQQFGWHMVAQVGDYDATEWHPSSSATRFECGSPNMLAIHALEASLALLLATGIDKIAESVMQLGQLIIDQAHERGFLLLTDTAPQRRSGIITFQVPNIDNQILYQQLMQAGVICAFRGGGIRFSPHFHTQKSQIINAFKAIDNLCR